MSEEELYKYAIPIGKIKEELHTFKDFSINYKIAKEQFSSYVDLFSLDTSFEKWFEEINFGAFPNGEGYAFDKQKIG